jgi:hypothetical protein
MVYMLPYMEDFDDEDYGSMMRQPPYSVVSLLSQYETQSPQSFTQLERYRVPRFFIRRIFRTIISFVLGSVNISRPLPQPAPVYAGALFNQLSTSRPTLINIFTYFGAPANISRNIMLNLITFVLNNLPFPGGTPGGESDQVLRRIVNAVAVSTNIIRDLGRFGITEGEARAVISSIARFVIRNSSPTPPVNIERRADELTDLLIRTANVYSNLTSRGVPAAQARTIIRTIILISLREVYR